MGRAGKALRKVLHDYGILQNHLAQIMGIDRSNVSRWVNGSRDPSAESAADIKNALAVINEAASDDFVKYYLYSPIETPIETVEGPDEGPTEFPEDVPESDNPEPDNREFEASTQTNLNPEPVMTSGVEV